MRTCKKRKDFEEALKKQGISILFRENEQGRIYDVTFIDHEQKCVFNGSRLGKEFSANVFNDLFSEKKKQTPEEPKHSFEASENTFRTKEENAGLGGIFDLLTPETGSSGADEMEENALTRRMKKRRKQKRI